MSEQEKKDVNEMDAAEMLEQHQGRDQTVQQKRPAEDEVAKLIREFDADAKRWHRRKGWEAFGLCVLSGLTVAACCVAAVYGCWKPVVVGIGAANLMMAGAWWGEANARWEV